MKIDSIHYPCSGCGSVMLFSPSKNRLLCPYCSNEESIPQSREIRKYDTNRLLSGKFLPRVDVKREIECPKCGVNYTFENLQVSTLCKYCSTPALTDFENPIKPESIAPFKIEQKEAHKIFADWIGSLWFAPSELKHLVDTQKKLVGYYLPYWLFDAETTSNYTGERGEAYYVTVERRRVVDGKEQIVQEQERRIRWYPVSGVVHRDFEDVSVSASDVIPYSLLQSLRARHSKLLTRFDMKFLSGFDTREYSIEPRKSYVQAKSIMEDFIRIDVLNDIGGDEQRIDSINTSYRNEEYKHTLFPIWSTHFRYKDKKYFYAIDGLSGEIVGERPYSYWKISILIFTIGVIIAIALYWDKIVQYFK